MKKLALFLLLLSPAFAHAGELGLSDQRNWESQWRALRARYNESDTNELRRHEREKELLAYGLTIPPRTILSGWLGTLSTLKVANIEGVGESVIGQIALQDPFSDTPHVICFAQALADMTPAWKAKLEAFEMGTIVEVSGEVLRQDVPDSHRDVPDAQGPDKRQSFVSLFRRAMQVQFGDGGKATEGPGASPAPVPFEKTFPKPRPFGVALYLLLKDINTADLSGQRTDEASAIHAMLSELRDLDSIYQELMSDSSEPDVYVGHGLIGKVEKALSCSAFIRLLDYAPCPEFRERARAIGITCPESGKGEASSALLWRPTTYPQRRESLQHALQVDADALRAKRLLQSPELGLADIRTQIDALRTELQSKRDDFRYVMDCLDREAQKWKGPETPPPPPAPYTAAEITPPQGLSWGMPYEQLRAKFPKIPERIADLKTSKRQLQWHEVPSGFTYVSQEWPLAGMTCCGTFVLDASGHLQAVRAYPIPGELVLSTDTFGGGEFYRKDLAKLAKFWREVRAGITDKYGTPARNDGDPRSLSPEEELRVQWNDLQGDQVVLRLYRDHEDPKFYHVVLVHMSQAFASLEKKVQGGGF